jgi:hypothetical protein
MTVAVEVQIDELVLEGFEPWERHGIADALAAELTRLFGASEASTASFISKTQDAVETQPVHFSENAQRGEVGTQVAQAVYAGLQTNE